MSAARDIRRAILPAATERGEGGGTGEGRPAPQPQLLRVVAGFIAWVTSSLAGIGAILYVTGYLSTVAQLHLLGLGRLIAYPSEHYLEEGGNFFIAIGPTLLLVLLLFSFILLAFSLLPPLRRRETPADPAAAEGKARRLARAWRGVVYALLLLTLFARFDLDVFAEPLTLSGLLLAEPGSSTGGSPAAQLQHDLASGERRPLEAAFSWRLYQEVLIAGLFITCWHVTQGWRFRLVALLPFAVAALLYTVFLPMLYGVLMGQMRFPVATLELADAPTGAAPPRLLLLSKGEQEFIVFDRDRRKLVWLPRDRVHRLEISGSEPLLGPPAPGGR